MELSLFLKSLLEQGTVTVNGQLISFTEADIQESVKILQEYYAADILEMPGTAPEFSEEAAVWAATYFYKAVQLTVIRDAGEDVIQQQLNSFPGTVTASAVYSADLILRYLPSLFELANGLAPADILVQQLRNTAVQWPFSSVGIDINESEINNETIFSHPSLKTSYIDRIIEIQDKKRVFNFQLEGYIYEATGEHINLLWPGFKTE